MEVFFSPGEHSRRLKLINVPVVPTLAVRWHSDAPGVPNRSTRIDMKTHYWLGHLLAVVFLVGTTGTAHAQDYINQTAIETVLTQNRVDDLEDLPEIYYRYQVLGDGRSNTVLARNSFYKLLGRGDMELGKERAKLVELLNRTLLTSAQIGDTLVVPEKFDADFRAYSPFPRYYPGARDFEKLFIIHKSIQAWAAYEYGQLARWGIVNTGAEESPTPTGRYNFNWKEEYRVSSLSPPGEPWEMYWVFNFHNARGIHIHQYPMPTGGPTSHGCVRLVDTDAKWIYDWADPWKVANGRVDYASAGSRVIEPGTTVIVIGDDPEGAPLPFDLKKRYPVLKRVYLPTHPYDIPAGTPQQEHFDRLRASR